MGKGTASHHILSLRTRTQPNTRAQDACAAQRTQQCGGLCRVSVVSSSVQRLPKPKPTANSQTPKPKTQNPKPNPPTARVRVARHASAPKRKVSHSLLTHSLTRRRPPPRVCRTPRLLQRVCCEPKRRSAMRQHRTWPLAGHNSGARTACAAARLCGWP